MSGMLCHMLGGLFTQVGKIELLAAIFCLPNCLPFKFGCLVRSWGNSRIEVIDSRGTSLPSGVEVLC